MGFDPITVIASLVALVLSLTLHEFAHALMGHYLGDTTARDQGRLTINPLAHIDPFTTLALPLMLILLHSPVVFGAAKPVPFNPWAVRGGRWGAAAVALAGPFTNLLLAIFFGLWMRFAPMSVLSEQFLGALVAINVAFFVFNMIPFPPLDGSRLLYAVAPSAVREVMDRIEQAGLMLLFFIMLIGYPLISPLVAKVVFAIMALIVPTGPLP
ncbi:MAG TPA: site-2 protease family protein [Candidatus Saccharimonadia bacterium]|nr:site-2 protease family protein [Candidatus Saccharimonadia bacterium]